MSGGSHPLNHEEVVEASSFQKSPEEMDHRVSRSKIYTIPYHEAHMEKALPSQYHSTMKVASKIAPTGLRAIQHQQTNISQAQKMILSFSTFKKEFVAED